MDIRVRWTFREIAKELPTLRPKASYKGVRNDESNVFSIKVIINKIYKYGK
jgi:hypothetical protein